MALQLAGIQAREAIRALRDGVPPDASVSRWMTCGLRGPLAEGGRCLLRVSQGSYQLSLVAGSNGAGKSHLLSLLRLQAEQQRFVVSFISQDIATGVSLNRPGLLYRSIVANLTSRVPTDDAFASLLNDWAQLAIPVLLNAKMNMSQFYLLRKAGLVPEFSPIRTTLCLLLYVWGVRLGSVAAAELALSALRGDTVENRSLCEAATGLGLEPGRVGWTPNVYKSEFWFGQLRTVIAMAMALGSPGVLIILDEIESLLELRLPSSKRRAYAEMSALFNNTYSWPNTWLVLAYTPAFLVGLQGDAEHLKRAVEMQIARSAASTTVSTKLRKVARQDVRETVSNTADRTFQETLTALRQKHEIDLPPRLEARDAECVVKHIREIFVLARGVAIRLPDPSQTVQRWTRTGGATRELVRMAVDECDRAASTSRVPQGLEPASDAALEQLARRFGRR